MSICICDFLSQLIKTSIFGKKSVISDRSPSQIGSVSVETLQTLNYRIKPCSGTGITSWFESSILHVREDQARREARVLAAQ